MCLSVLVPSPYAYQEASWLVPANVGFGGDDWKTLYFTSRNHLGSVKVKIPGVPVPALGK